jgi:hypothetical protein
MLTGPIGGAINVDGTGLAKTLTSLNTIVLLAMDTEQRRLKWEGKTHGATSSTPAL